MKVDELPLLELFTRLRQAGLPLGMNEYQAVLQALRCGFGIPDRQALARLCCTLWVKSAEDKLLFDYHFQQVMAKDEEELVPVVEPLPMSPQADLPKNPIVSWWRRISLPTRVALGGTLILVTGAALWLGRPIKECPYFTSSSPKSFVKEGENYTYHVKACKTGNNLEIKVLQKHPWLNFQDNQDGTAILRGKVPTQDIQYFNARLWNLQGKQLANFDNLKNIEKISFSPNGQHLVTRPSDNKARLWNLQGKQLASFDNLKNIEKIGFSPNGQHLVTSSSDNTARLWNLQGKQLANFDNLKNIEKISFSPNGQHLVTRSSDNKARLWNLQGKQLNIFGNLKNIREISFSSNGKYLVTHSWGNIGRLWNLQGKQLNIFGNLKNIILEISFSPNGQYLVTRSWSNRYRLWNLQGKQLANFDNLKNIRNISFSPNEQYLVTLSSDYAARLWNLQGKQLAHFDNLKNIRNISFSPNGQYLVTQLLYDEAQLWNLKGKQLANFNLNNIKEISFSPNGQYLTTVSVSSEVELKVTDKATGNSDTQTFSLRSYNSSVFQQEILVKWLIICSIINSLLFPLMMVGYIIARRIAEHNAKPTDFPPLPKPKDETPTPISNLNQGLEDEVQVAQAVHQGTSRSIDVPLSYFTQTNEYFPVTGRQMKQSWRSLRRLIREGSPMQLDVEATVNQISRKGMLVHPVLQPRRVNRNELLLLVDQDGSMATFHSLSERLANTAIQGGRLGKAGIYYFHNCPREYIYQDPYHQVAKPISEVLSQLHPEYTGVLIFSDAGAARGAFNRQRLDLTAEFLAQLRQQLRYVAWLNPIPRERWQGTAGEIAKLVPMFELNHQGLNQAIDVLRGKPTTQMV